MKYLLGIILIIFGIYLFWRCESGELPDIEDVETCHVEPEKPWPRSERGVIPTARFRKEDIKNTGLKIGFGCIKRKTTEETPPGEGVG